MGTGPMTGRQAGYCAGNMVPGGASAGGFGRGGGIGRGGGGMGRGGGGRGRRNQFLATGLTRWQRAAAAEGVPEPPVVKTPPVAEPSSQQEIEALKAQLAGAEGVIRDMKQQLDSLQKGESVEEAKQ